MSETRGLMFEGPFVENSGTPSPTGERNEVREFLGWIRSRVGAPPLEESVCISEGKRRDRDWRTSYMSKTRGLTFESRFVENGASVQLVRKMSHETSSRI